MPGPQEFPVQPLYSDPIWVDGQQLVATPPGFTKEPVIAPASVITMHSGRSLVQVPYFDSGQAEAHGLYYRFRFAAEAYLEDDWYTLVGLAKGPQPVYLVTYGTEVEVFVAGPELAAFTLPRPSAVSVFPGFASAGLAPRAYVDGVEVTEVAVAPGAGEFRLVGSTLDIGDALTAGQVVRVRYYPAYQVAPEAVPVEQFSAYQQVSAEVVLVEARA